MVVRMWACAAFLLQIAPAQVAQPAVAPAQIQSSASVDHPADPFAGTYELPRERELGATAGQFRMTGAGLLALGGEVPEFGVHGSLELLTFAYLGVRGSLQTTFTSADSEPLVFMAKTGPSLHLLPYRRFDLSLFFEGGVAVVEPTKKNSTPMAVMGPGGTLEIWLDHWLFARGEGHMDWGLYEQRGASYRYLRFVGLLGLGIAL